MTFEEWLDNQIDERMEVYQEIGKECYDEGYQQGRADAIDEYTEWLRKAHANFDEDYAEDIKSDYLEQLKEQKNG